MRFQDPKIERMGKKRAYFQIRPTLPVIVAGRVERKRTPVRLGWCDEMTLSAAKVAKQVAMSTINGGAVVLQAQMPLKALIERFRALHLPTLASTTRARYESHLTAHIEPGLGHLRLGEINRALLSEWLLAKADISKASRCNLRGLLASIFTQAEEWKLWSGPNPAHRAKVGRGEPVRTFRKPTIEQTRLFLDSIRDTPLMPAWKSRQIAEVCLIAGTRVSEALGLRWSDLEGHAIRIERRFARGNWDVTKTPASLRTRQIGALADEIRFQRPASSSDDDPVFLRKDGQVPNDRYLQCAVFRPAAKLAGIYHEGFGLHSLRRLSITWRQECGATALETMRQAGHTTLGMTAGYTLDDPAKEAAVADRMRERIR